MKMAFTIKEKEINLLSKSSTDDKLGICNYERETKKNKYLFIVSHLRLLDEKDNKQNIYIRRLRFAFKIQEEKILLLQRRGKK